jgi:PAS domain S-box-containing protein
MAAFLAFKANQINKKYNVTLYLHKNNNRIPIASMLALTTLGIRKGDKIFISCQGKGNVTQALKEMMELLSGEIDKNTENLDEVDKVLDENTITSEKIIESISNGVVVVNESNIVILFNRAAEKITGIPRNKIVGKKADEVIENSRLHYVLQTGKELIGAKQKIGNTTIITNRSPIIVDGRIVGAVAVFQDITQIDRLSNELESVKEIKEQLTNIVENTNDGISMVNDVGIITYVNPAFEKMLGIKKDQAIGKDINKLLPNSASSIVLKTKKKQLGIAFHKEDGMKIISNASPIFTDSVFKGVVATYKEVTELQKMIEKLNQAEERIKYFQEELSRKEGIDEAFEIIVGKSSILKEVLTIASKAAKTSSTVLIQGESGTGKELVAKAIHRASSRKNKPFIRVNCAAIPENLLESELFGYEKGAFTGALRRKLGKFELADGGTIFLDEIGEISKGMQVKLLRVLQEMEFERVGGIETIKVDIRIIAATNRNLKEMVDKGEFREDLYYRLNVIPVTLPPLRERKEDIPLLVEHFIKKICVREKVNLKRITPKAMEYLQKYSWPGNIRELENILERALTLYESDILNEECLPDYIRIDIIDKEKDLINLKNGELATLEEYEKHIIKAALEKYKSFNKAGKVLGITHRTVALKARKYGLV